MILCVTSAFLCASAVKKMKKCFTAEAQRNAEVTQRNQKQKGRAGNWAVTAGPPFHATVGANTWPPVAEPFGPSSEWRCPWKIVDYFFMMLRRRGLTGVLDASSCGWRRLSMKFKL